MLKLDQENLNAFLRDIKVKSSNAYFQKDGEGTIHTLTVELIDYQFMTRDQIKRIESASKMRFTSVGMTQQPNYNYSDLSVVQVVFEP